MKESNNQLDENQLTEDIDTATEEINMDPSLEQVKAPKGMKEAVMRKIYEHEHPEIFEGLSEEDKKALWIGREMLAKEGEREKGSDIRPDTGKPRKTRKTKKFTAKVYALVAVVAVAMLAIGITSVGGPQHLAQMVDEMFAGRSQVNMDSLDENVIEVSHEEEKAFQKVKDELGFEAVRLYYKPEGMVFKEAQVDDNLQVALFTYSYRDKRINYNIVTNYRSRSLKFDIEDILVDEYTIGLDRAEVLIKQYRIEESGETEYVAQFEVGDAKYTIAGVIDKESFEEIIKNLKFF